MQHINFGDIKFGEYIVLLVLEYSMVESWLFEPVFIRTCIYSNLYLFEPVFIRTCIYSNLYLFEPVFIWTNFHVIGFPPICTVAYICHIFIAVDLDF